ncbi:hypothetical protein [Shimia sp. SDUM112013]|uniref:hypothetical protein n=1 Tax=Shimia sp. SDUM112013 TaxID=3136160 RepID=UPI0032EF87E5
MLSVHADTPVLPRAPRNGLNVAALIWRKVAVTRRIKRHYHVTGLCGLGGGTLIPAMASASSQPLPYESNPAWVQLLIAAIVIAALARLVWASR